MGPRPRPRPQIAPPVTARPRPAPPGVVPPQPRHIPPGYAPPPPRTRLPKASEPRPAQPAPLRTPADTIRSVCDDAWVLGLATRAAEAVAAPVWQQAEEAWNAEHCQGVAAVADALEGMIQTVHDALGGVGWAVSSIALPGEASLRTAAQATRVLGIALCVEHDEVGGCACLVGFAHAESDELVAARLEDGLRALAA